MGLAMMAIYLFIFTRAQALLWLGSAFVFILSSELARLKSPWLNQRVMRFWGPIMRSCEVNRLSGVPFYVGATFISIAIFPKPIAILSVVCLAVGDPMASLFGILYGNKSIRFSNGKSLIGTLAGVLACIGAAATTLFYFQDLGLLLLSRDHFWLISVIAGLAGGSAELLPMEIDDNFAIPVVSGFVLWLAFIFLEIRL
jgi:dolichol kinase